MRALVTGGAGFIGSHLVDALVQRGDDVIAVDDLSRGLRERVNERAGFERCDVTEPAFGQLVSTVRPEIIFHQAAQIDVRRSVREPLLDTRINVVGMVNVLQSAVDAGVRRVVFASSGGTVYGDADILPTPASAPFAPTSQYGAAKAAAEVYGRMYQRLHGLEFVALRYANVFGPRQDPHGEAGVVAIFAERLLRGETPTINGDGRQTRDYVYVGDVVAANLAAVTAPPGAYNVGTGVETSVTELFDVIARACGSAQAAAHGPAKAGEQLRSCLAIDVSAEQLTWTPQVALADGIAQTVASFRGASV
jgi:UDP-glucose 4-epimerase